MRKPPRLHAGAAPSGPVQILPPTVRQVKTLIWIYFWLIIFEGSLRKWVVPALANPLLVIRDPIALLIYIQAIRGNFFPRNFLVRFMIGLGVVTFFYGIVQAFGEDLIRLAIAAYGVRTFFFHLPLIFVIGNVFDTDDVIKMGKWILLLCIPMTALMVAQYQSPPDSFLNAATVAKEDGDMGGQLIAAMGKIRPAGTFSFITGPAMFYPLATVFLLLGLVRPRTYPTWLLWAAAASTILVQPVSGSRTVVLTCGLVCAAMVVAGFFNPKVLPRMMVLGAVLFGIGLAVLATPVGKESVESFTERWNAANRSEGQGQGDVAALTKRASGGFLEVFQHLNEVPVAGVGLGVGTNVGSKLLTGGVTFLAGEQEWTRIVFESGIFLGFAYIIFRVMLAFSLLVKAFFQLQKGRFLPWLLVVPAFVQLLAGQTQQPTILGMMVLMAGLSQASMVKGSGYAGDLSVVERRRLEDAKRKRRPGGIGPRPFPAS